MSTEERAAALNLASGSAPEVANVHVRHINVIVTILLALIGILIALNVLIYHKDFRYEEIKPYVWSTVICLCSSLVGFAIAATIKPHHIFVATVSHINYGFALAAVGTLVLLALPSQIGIPLISILFIPLMFVTCKLFRQSISSIFRPVFPAENSGGAPNVQLPDTGSNSITDDAITFRINDLQSIHSSVSLEANDANGFRQTRTTFWRLVRFS